MKNLRLSLVAALFTLCFLFIGITINAQIHPPTIETKEKTEAVASNDYLFHTQFDEKHNFKLEKMLSKKLGKRSGLSSKSTKVWTRFGGKKVDGLQIAVSKGDLKIKYDKSGGDALTTNLKDLLSEITNLIYAKDGTFKMKVEGEL